MILPCKDGNISQGAFDQLALRAGAQRHGLLVIQEERFDPDSRIIDLLFREARVYDIHYSVDSERRPRQYL